MAEIVKAGLLCPLRSTEKGMEVFLTRRAFWDNEHERPMKYPGEWACSGGSYEEGDKNLLGTGIREFREETKYKGPVTDTGLLYTATTESHDKTYRLEFYAAKIDSGFTPEITDDGEIIDARWMLVDDALELIFSEEFTKEQMTEFKSRRLDDPKYGIYTVTERQYPIQNINALRQIQSCEQELMAQY